MRTRNLVMVLAAVLITALTVLAGCKKKEEAPAPPPVEPNKTVAVEAQAEQTMCPIMDGNKIDKNVFVEYKGKKVYFCCPVCKGQFDADPEKYISKLPQFQK